MSDISGPGPHIDQRAQIFKRLRSPGINSLESNLPAYVAWQAGTIILYVVPALQATRLSELIPWLLRRLHVRAQVSVPVTYTAVPSARHEGLQEWNQRLRGLPRDASLAGRVSL
jgi:hypothetical protein